MEVLIAGGGIAGVAMGLTLHQIGVPFRIFEAVAEMKPLGVGINLQPNAVREIIDLGLMERLDAIGVRTRDYGFYTRTGLEIWTEPRGLHAGYAWPQVSVHRGTLLIMLRDALIERAGTGVIEAGRRVTGFANRDGAAVLQFDDGSEEVGALAIGADGIHSAVRAQMVPDEGPPVWDGRVLWRATTRAAPYLSGASMFMAGHDDLRIVAYPISVADADGLATINWLAEKRYDKSQGWTREDYNRTVPKEKFAPFFADWRFDWLDIPALIDGAEEVLEYPMVDRDPLSRWQHGRVTLVGDAAHVTYPVGSNGASLAILDCRELGAAMLEHGVTEAALAAYEAKVRPITENVVRTNRAGGGPDAVMQLVEDRTGGDFARMWEVVTHDELAAHAAKYKALSAMSIDELNARPPTIPPGARVG